MTTIRVLDLFCKAGGCSRGYYDGFTASGFTVKIVGVDIEPQPNYPYEFVQTDAMTYPLDGFDFIHASPPCQHYSVTRSLHASKTVDLYEPTRARLEAQGTPWVIENVIGAPYRSGFLLCGSMFGLGVWRHRNFESSELLFRPSCRHHLVPEPIDVTGVGGPRRFTVRSDGGGSSRKPSSLAQAREVMGIDWMTRRELSQAIPPAYTAYVASQIAPALAAVLA